MWVVREVSEWKRRAQQRHDNYFKFARPCLVMLGERRGCSWLDCPRQLCDIVSFPRRNILQTIITSPTFLAWFSLCSGHRPPSMTKRVHTKRINNSLSRHSLGSSWDALDPAAARENILIFLLFWIMVLSIGCSGILSAFAVHLKSIGIYCWHSHTSVVNFSFAVYVQRADVNIITVWWKLLFHGIFWSVSLNVD